MRDPDVESAEKASSSLAVPQPPVPPPELTKSGKPLTHKEKKEVCTSLYFIANYPDGANPLSLKIKPLAQIGSTYPLPQRLIYLDCTEKWKRSVFGTSSTRNASTERTRVREKESKGYPNILQ